MNEDSPNSWIVDSWRGKSPAYKVFWVYAVSINLLFSVSGVAAGYFSAFYSWISYIGFLIAPLYLIFIVWFCLSLWRCAFNVDWSGWGYLSRVLVALVAAGTLNQLLQLANFIVSG